MKKKDRLYKNASGPVKIRMTNDYLFKALLQRNHRVLKALVCSLLHYDLKKVSKIEIMNPISLGEAADEKTIYLDVNIRLADDKLLNLEMQVTNANNWPERSLFYAARNYTSLTSGADYINAKDSIQIGLLDYTLFKDNPAFYSTYRLMDTRTHFPYSEKFSIGVVDLTRIDLATEEDKRYNIDKWARLFKATSWEEIKMIANNYAYIEDAAETVYQLSEDEKVRLQCQAREDYYRQMNDVNFQINSAKKELQRVKRAKSRLEGKNAQLEGKNAQLEGKNAQLEGKNAQLEGKNAQLEEENARLLAELGRLKKDSNKS